MEKEEFSRWWDFFKFLAGGRDELISLISKNISSVIARDILESGVARLTEKDRDRLYEGLKELLRPKMERLLELYLELSELIKKKEELEKKIEELRREMPSIKTGYPITCPVCGKVIYMPEPIAFAVKALGKEVVCPEGHRFRLV